MTKRVNEVLSIMEDYFTNYLPFVKGLSSNTIKSYQYAFQLLFKYLEAEKNISPEQISFHPVWRTPTCTSSSRSINRVKNREKRF